MPLLWLPHNFIAMSEPNIFISWSRERSRFTADALRHWLPTVIQAAKPWMSAKDIEKGTRGVQEIAHALNGTRIGIICLTPENTNEPWILYEAGALSKSVNDDKTRICTLLLGGLRFQDIEPPLGNFQHTKPDKEDIWSLIQSINNALSDSPVAKEPLKETFEALWPNLERELKKLPEPQEVSRPERSSEEMLAEILDTVRGGRDNQLNELKRALMARDSELTELRFRLETVSGREQIMLQAVQERDHAFKELHQAWQETLKRTLEEVSSQKASKI